MDKKIVSTITTCALLSILILGSLTAVATDPPNDNIAVNSVEFSKENIKAGEDFSVKVMVTNNADNAVTVQLSLISKTLQDNGTINDLPENDNATKTLEGRAGKAGKKIKVKVNGKTEVEKTIKSAGGEVKEEEGGYSLPILIIVATLLFAVGIGFSYKVFGGPGGGGGPPVYTAPSKRDASEAADARRGAGNAINRADNYLSEAREAEADVSTEEELMGTAKNFHNMAEEEQSDDRFDSAFAYAQAASTLGQGVSQSIEKKREAAEEAEDDIKAAEMAVEGVEENIEEARDRGIDVTPARTLSELASKITETAPEAGKAEVYRFQSETAQKIAEHAKDSLESSISEQEDQIERTEERIDDADEALEGVEELIEKRRDEFDTLMPEYWQKIAEEVREIADDTSVNAEVREAMADTTIRICEWIESMFERRDLRSRMKEEGGGGILRR